MDMPVIGRSDRNCRHKSQPSCRGWSIDHCYRHRNVNGRGSHWRRPRIEDEFFAARWPHVHPGAHLRELLTDTRSMSPRQAMRLAAVLDTPALYWLVLQARHDLAREARRATSSRLYGLALHGLGRWRRVVRATSDSMLENDAH